LQSALLAPPLRWSIVGIFTGLAATRCATCLVPEAPPTAHHAPTFLFAILASFASGLTAASWRLVPGLAADTDRVCLGLNAALLVVFTVACRIMLMGAAHSRSS
jgi:hypothetical protein